MRLLLVGAFRHPHAQGSQVYFQEQAIALRAAGAEVELLTYGPGSGGRDGFVHIAPPAWAVPRSGRSGPRPAKAIADLFLARSLRRTLALADASETRARQGSRTASSNAVNSAQSASSAASSGFSDGAGGGRATSRTTRRPTFDAILAHHAEAALLALHALPSTRPPVVYCAHTLLEQELPEYFKPLPPNNFPAEVRDGGEARGAHGPRPGTDPASPAPGPSLRRAARAFGRVIDRHLASGSDAWIALTQATERVMRASGEAPGRRLAPPIREPGPLPAQRSAAAIARAHGLEPGGFFLYAGNLDPYQDLPLLEQVARARRDAARAGGPPGSAASRDPLPIVIASHDPQAGRAAAASAGSAGSGLRLRRVDSAAEVQGLLAAARASLVPRRSLGGFPIKLANSLAAGTPVVALHGAEWGLEDGRDALIGEIGDPVASLVRALVRLEREPGLAARLGAGARATWQAQHEPARIAAETLALLEALRRRR